MFSYTYTHMLIIGAVLFVCCYPISANKNVRLSGGTTPFEGRVEVYNDGSWGTICNVGWDNQNAFTVCKELGFSGAMTTVKSNSDELSPFGEGEGKIWFSNVSCSGGEESIFDCGKETGPFNDGNTCTHRHDVWVYCLYPGYFGCFLDMKLSKTPVFQDYSEFLDNDEMSIGKCVNHCRKQSGVSEYAALRGGSQCRCGQYQPSGHPVLSAPYCSVLCTGDNAQTCGNADASTVYSTSLGKCGYSRYNQDSGWIVSPEFPSEYPPQSNCFWQLYATTGSQFSLTLKSLYLPDDWWLDTHDTIAFHYLEGRRSSVPFALSQRRLRDYHVGITEGNSLRVDFVSGSFYNDLGFTLYYEVISNLECEDSPCFNGGSCYKMDDNDYCQCTEGYKGVRCETQINTCLSNPCQNNGVCQAYSVNNNDTYYCHCEDGYTGMNCEKDAVNSSISTAPPITNPAILTKQPVYKFTTTVTVSDLITSDSPTMDRVRKPLPIGGIIGGGIAILVLILSILITVIICRRKKSSPKGSNTPNVDYDVTWRRNGYEQVNVDENVIDERYQTVPSLPEYAQVIPKHKRTTASHGTKDAMHIDESNETNNGDTRDVNSSEEGFVDNIIYESEDAKPKEGLATDGFVDNIVYESADSTDGNCYETV